ncbi:MAG: hypothetical protein Q9N62_02860 [Ghiorsea sp.]|nr:hypothetical protein [Ghiorsea sp.]
MISALIDPYTGLLRTKDQVVAIYTFDDTVNLVQDFTSSPTVVTQAIVSVRQNVPAVTSTNLYGAIIDGLAKATTQAELTSLTEGHVIVMTDGRDTSSYYSIYTTASHVSTSPNTLHLIGVQSPDLNPSVMKSLAN